MGIILVGSCLVGNCPSGELSSGELSWWVGNHPGVGGGGVVMVGNCPGWSYPVGNCRVGSCPDTGICESLMSIALFKA